MSTELAKTGAMSIEELGQAPDFGSGKAAPQGWAPQEALLIPKVLLMQPASTHVKDPTNKTQAGDIFRPLDRAVLARMPGTVEVIPISVTEYWREERWPHRSLEVQGKWRSKRLIPRTPENTHLKPRSPYVDWIDKNNPKLGKEICRIIQNTTLFAIVVKDIEDFYAEQSKEIPDPTKTVQPTRFDFKGGSWHVGQAVQTYFKNVETANTVRKPGQPPSRPYHHTMILGADLVTLKDNDFYAYTYMLPNPPHKTKVEWHAALEGFWGQKNDFDKKSEPVVDKDAEESEG
jgi:hypothetical protein